MRRSHPKREGIHPLRGLVAAVAALAMAGGAGATSPEQGQGQETARNVPSTPSLRWEAQLAPEGRATLLRIPPTEEGERAIWELQVELAPDTGKQAWSTYLRRGTCEDGGDIVAKAQRDMNVGGERSTIRIPPDALPPAWIGPHPADDPVPPTPATGTLSVDVIGRDGGRIACGELRSDLAVASP